MQFLCTHYMYDSCNLAHTIGRFDLWANWTPWTPLNVEVFLTWDLFSWWFSTDSGGKSPFFTTISRNIFPFCSHPTNCNKQIQVSNTARIRFRVPYDPQQISLNQQKHRFISPIRCAFRDEHRFPAGFEFHGKVPVICVSKNPCYPFKNRKCLGLSFSYLNIKHLALFFLNVKIKQ